MSTCADLLVEKCGGVLQVTLNRPQKRNALSRGMLAELREVFETAAADQTLLVAVLQGAGEKCFAAGGDLRDLSTVRTQEDTVVMADAGRAALEAVRRFPVPVVAALKAK